MKVHELIHLHQIIKYRDGKILFIATTRDEEDQFWKIVNQKNVYTVVSGDELAQSAPMFDRLVFTNMSSIDIDWYRREVEPLPTPGCRNTVIGSMYV